MDKPNVARRIVRAIRQGNPPGRFLKKNDDGLWYDVGDRCAAEKTSQGLRERSNAEKRQRSALRETLRGDRVRKSDDTTEASQGDGSGKKQKIDGTAGMSGIVPSYVSVTPQLNYAGGIPMSLSMKEQPKDGKGKKVKKGKDGEEEENSESLPPNAVDKDGNIRVTDYDILCGRGGLTNHHKGKKRMLFIMSMLVNGSSRFSRCREQAFPGYRGSAQARLRAGAKNSKAQCRKGHCQSHSKWRPSRSLFKKGRKNGQMD